MKNNLKKLGDAELEIMQVLWSGSPPMTSVEIHEKTRELRDWPLSTLMTSLSRLQEKGYVICERPAGMNLYSPAVSENDYKAGESRSFLKKLYNNSARSLVATLYNNNMLSEDDIKELRDYVNRLEGDRRD